MIVVERLRKTFGAAVAVDDLSFEALPGRVTALVGRNGAGKTSALRLLLGLLVPTAGSARVRGFDPVTHPMEVKRCVGYVPDAPEFYESIRAHEVVELVAEVHGATRAAASGRASQILADLGLAENARGLPGRFSLGMRKRLALACALVHEPPVLILDEPTGGLDPYGCESLRARLVAEVACGKTILMSTHRIDFAESLGAHVVAMDSGRLIAQGSVPSLRCEAREGSPLSGMFLSAVASPGAH